IALLHSLGAIEIKAKTPLLTKHGERMSALPAHPRLAHMLLCGAEIGQARCATHLASLLSDRDPFAQHNPDINHRLQILSGKSPCPAQNRGWLRRTLDMARQFEAKLTANEIVTALTEEQLAGYLLACAYPDRIARRRHSGGYQLANGRSANLTVQHYLGNSRWLAIAEISSRVGSNGDSIRTAVALDETLFSTVLSDAVQNQTIAAWDKKNGRFVAEQQKAIGALILQSNKLDQVPTATRTSALIQHMQQEGLQMLCWTEEIQQWRARVSLLREFDGTDWPDVSQPALRATLDSWLAPYLDKVNQLADFKKLPLKDILYCLLNYQQQQRLQQLAPTKLKVPSGSYIAIDYSETPPVLAVKLQEMFGAEQTPSVVAGKVPLVVHLLSPAGRPLQITQDLAGFWRNSYHQVKKEMKGRYPKHPWPDDPLVAAPTRRTKRHG
ncbi:MAG: ATP-dependent helicase HrpB, partial [Gammaproteobacteria bacterium]|nr:ATP-dependent helicase HrpB [Gammaproteobacteria bacterium]